MNPGQAPASSAMARETHANKAKWRHPTLGLLCFCWWYLPLLVCGGLPPDGTGLVGSAPAPDHPSLPLKFWANPRKSALKPRRRDLHDATLLRLMGPDYDAQWMKRAQHHHPPPPPLHAAHGDTEQRQTVLALRDLMSEGDLPGELPQEYRALVKAWLVRTATCPIKYVWDDLGAYFWPRWIKRGECDNQAHHTNQGMDLGSRAAKKNSSGFDRDVKYSPLSPAPSCSWPPGMMCVPGVARNLQILRWHCRLRKKGGAHNNVWSTARMRNVQERRTKRRRKYRCLWLKVPYPVPEDCVCSC